MRNDFRLSYTENWKYCTCSSLTVWLFITNCIASNFTSFLTLLYPTDRSFSRFSVALIIFSLCDQYFMFVMLPGKEFVKNHLSQNGRKSRKLNMTETYLHLHTYTLFTLFWNNSKPKILIATSSHYTINRIRDLSTFHKKYHVSSHFIYRQNHIRRNTKIRPLPIC